MVINVERCVSPHPAELYSSFLLFTKFLFKVSQKKDIVVADEKLTCASTGSVIISPECYSDLFI